MYQLVSRIDRGTIRREIGVVRLEDCQVSGFDSQTGQEAGDDIGASILGPWSTRSFRIVRMGSGRAETEMEGQQLVGEER